MVGAVFYFNYCLASLRLYILPHLDSHTFAMRDKTKTILSQIDSRYFKLPLKQSRPVFTQRNGNFPTPQFVKL